MKKRLALILSSMVVIALIGTGCGSQDKLENSNSTGSDATPDANTATEVEETSNEVDVINETATSDDLKKVAKEEGISVKELEAMVDELAQLGADKYGVSKAEYVEQIEKKGHTVLGEWEVAALQMDMSLKEIYTYEKSNVNPLNDEQKEMMSNLTNASEMAQAEISKLSQDSAGVYGDSAVVNRVVTVDVEKDFAYKVDEVDQEYQDDFGFEFDYYSKADLDELVTYFDEMVMNTEGYTKVDQPGSGAMLDGKVNGSKICIILDAEVESRVLITIYMDLSTQKEN